MPTVFAFNGTLFGYGVTDAERVSLANATYYWSPNRPVGAQKGSGKVLTGQTSVLAFRPLESGYPSLTEHKLSLFVGKNSEVSLNTEDNPELFEVLGDGAVLVSLDDDELAKLSVGYNPVELWDDTEDAPISNGGLTVVSSIRPA